MLVGLALLFLAADQLDQVGVVVLLGRAQRGEQNALVAGLGESGDSYADVRAALRERETLLADLAGEGRTSPDAVVSAYADRREA